ncbi:MAG: hypothetical protein M1820_004937 [Bogoriella megaspora]|nr:MAG: hypothetical protein M1820_004937 [Bogoriella megaspora]
MTDTTTGSVPTHNAPVHVPRIAITYCTQCKWLLRAAYFAQELLSTFGTMVGEIALIPATGGIFTVRLYYEPEKPEHSATSVSSAIESMETAEGTGDASNQGDVATQEVLIWDRKAEGGFPGAYMNICGDAERLGTDHMLTRAETKILKQRIRDYLEPGKNLGHSDTAERKEAAKQKESNKEDSDGVCKDC